MEQIAAELPKNPDVVKKVNAVFQVFHRFTPDFRTPHAPLHTADFHDSVRHDDA